MALPIICVYPFVSKYYVEGMMLGGVKEWYNTSILVRGYPLW
jgi:hypothetical protein